MKVGVIGLGYWGPKLARNFYELPDATLEWVCDLNPARLEQVAKLYPGAHATTNYKEVLASNVDAVCISTPLKSHHRLAMDALQAGKHILVEKPLASCVDQAGEIVLESKRRGLVVMVGHTFVYNPAVIAMKEIIDSGALGQIYYINGIRVNLGLFQPDINVVWDLAPHDVSILLYVMGMEPVTASARGEVYVQREKGLHDVAFLSFFFPNGVMADIRISWLDPCKIRRYTVVGSEKMLVYDDVEPENKIVIYDKGVTIPPYTSTEEEFRLSYRTGDAVPYPVKWVEPLREECQHFVDCVSQGLEPRSNARMGLEVVRILETVQHSLLNGNGREGIGDTRGFCAHRTGREVRQRCKDLCLREFVWM